ncbi:MAG: ATP-binding protein [bacterium]
MSDFPYPGLRPFRRDETDIFFGREEQVDQLLERLDQSRFLAVVGPSGCGKSSLVQAGLFAALETGFLVSAGVRWRTAKTRPGTCPMRHLAKALVKKSALGPERGEDDESAAFLLATLRRGPLGLIDALSMTLLPQGTNLLILVDQFEEIFRYRQQYSLDEAEAFVALLLAATQQKTLPVYVVITMRSDFLGDCALFRGLPEAIDEGQFLTPRLSREQCRAAIIGPAEVFGGEVEQALVNRLLNDMGEDSEQLPLFQHALMRMWREAGKRAEHPILTLGDYEAIGGLENALSNHADEAFEELDEKQKTIAEVLFRSLSERSESLRDTRRPSRLSEIVKVAGVHPEQVKEVVDIFRRPDRSFLTPPAGIPLTSETIIDISHESLIRLWKRLNTWVEVEADSADTYIPVPASARPIITSI